MFQFLISDYSRIVGLFGDPLLDSDDKDEYDYDPPGNADGEAGNDNGYAAKESMDLIQMGEVGHPREARNIQAAIASGDEGLIGDLDEDFEEEDIDHRQIHSDYQKLRINVYPQMCTGGFIGSVHSSNVRLRFVEELEDIFNFAEVMVRLIEPCRKKMATTGGQGYMPGYLENFLVKQRENTGLLAALPLLLTRVLSSNPGSFDNDKQALYKELVDNFFPLQELMVESQSRIKNGSCNTVRFEFFFMTTLKKPKCDIQFPAIDFPLCIKRVMHDEYTTTWLATINLYLIPLSAVIGQIRQLSEPGSGRLPAIHDLSPEFKTYLLLCMEMLVSFLGIIGFRGRVMKSIQSIVGPSPFWSLPDDLKTDLTEEESEFCPHGITSSAVLPVPNFVVTAKITEEQLKRSPACIQSLRGELRNKLNMPVGYFAFTGRIKQILFKFDRVFNTTGNGFFDEVNHAKLASISDEQRVRMFEHIAQVCCDAYDAEWWFIIRERTCHEMNHTNWSPSSTTTNKLVDFPQTVKTYQKWVAAQGTFWIQPSVSYIHSTPEIVDRGKFLCLFVPY